MRSLFQFFSSHLRSLVLDQCQHLFPTSLTLSLLLSLWCLQSLKPCQIELVIISFFPWGKGYSYCLCVRARVWVLKDVLSPSIIHQVSAIAAHVMLEGEGVKGRYQERQREEDGIWRTEIWQILFCVAVIDFPYPLLYHFLQHVLKTHHFHSRFRKQYQFVFPPESKCLLN